MKIINKFLSIFVIIFSLFSCYEEKSLNPGEVRVTISSNEFIGEKYDEVTNEMKKMGFKNIEYEIIYDLITGWLVSDGEVEKVLINGDFNFYKGDIFMEDDLVVIEYHTFKKNNPNVSTDSNKVSETSSNSTEKDSVSSSLGSNDGIMLPINLKDYEGKQYEDVINELIDLGFNNIKERPLYDLNGGWFEFTDDGEVESVLINDSDDYKKGDRFNADVEIIVKYHTLEDNAPIVEMPHSDSYYSDREDWTVDIAVKHFEELGFYNFEITKSISSEYEFDEIKRVEINNDESSFGFFDKGTEIKVYEIVKITWVEPTQPLTIENSAELMWFLNGSYNYADFSKDFDGAFLEFEAYVSAQGEYMFDGGDYMSISPGKYENRKDTDIKIKILEGGTRKVGENIIIICQVDDYMCDYYKCLCVHRIKIETIK